MIEHVRAPATIARSITRAGPPVGVMASAGRWLIEIETQANYVVWRDAQPGMGRHGGDRRSDQVPERALGLPEGDPGKRIAFTMLTTGDLGQIRHRYPLIGICRKFSEKHEIELSALPRGHEVWGVDGGPLLSASRAKPALPMAGVSLSTASRRRRQFSEALRERDEHEVQIPRR
jgi:hypothetical protein